MSKSRNRYIQRGPEDWRRKSHQQPGRRVEEERAFQLELPLTVKPGLLSTMVVLCVLGSLASAAAQPLTKQKSIKTLADDKITVDNTLTRAQQRQLNCSHIPELFHNAAVKLPIVQPMFARVLNNPKFTIRCTVQEKLYDANGNDFANGLVVADPTTGSIVMILADQINEDSVIHEATHADWLLMHGTKQCYQANLVHAALPFKAVEERYVEYVDALNKGDARLNEFKRLREAVINKKTLTPKEEKKFKQYQAASADCLPMTTRTSVNQPVYERISRFFAEYPNEKFYHGKFTMPDGEWLAAVPRFTSYNKPNLFITMMKYDREQVVATHVERVKTLLQEGYSEANQVTLLLERDAYTFQILSENARKTFYPEAHALREAEMKRCQDKNENTRRLEL